MIVFELIFYLVLGWVKFVLLHEYVQLSQHHVLKTVLSPFKGHGLLVKNQLTMYGWVYVWDLNHFPLICMPPLLPILSSFDQCSFVVDFETEKSVFPNSVFLFKIVFAILGLFHLHRYFKMSFLFLSSSAPPLHGWEDLFPSLGVCVWEAEEHSAGKRPHSSNDPVVVRA